LLGFSSFAFGAKNQSGIDRNRSSEMSRRKGEMVGSGSGSGYSNGYVETDPTGRYGRVSIYSFCCSLYSELVLVFLFINLFYFNFVLAVTFLID
jgi:hypothetical protein